MLIPELPPSLTETSSEATINITPTQWQGYFRSAHHFASLGKLVAALRVCSLALECLGEDPKHDGRVDDDT